MGSGNGRGVAIDPADARRRSYLRGVWGKIDRSWSASSFPKWAALEGRGGYTIVSFVIGPRGEVSRVSLARRSGYPGFDAAMRAAVQQAAPFGPPPDDLAPPFRHQHDFVVKNPAVR
jgi:TonB family protein